MPSFTKDYLVFDEFGLKEILCMACGNPIKKRVEVKSEIDPKVIIREMSKNSDYREIPVLLESGQIAFLMVCDNCKFIEIGKNEVESITQQLKNALKIQLEFEGKLPDMIEAILKERNFQVLRKAEIPEVTHALRGA